VAEPPEATIFVELVKVTPSGATILEGGVTTADTAACPPPCIRAFT
jgi:hypothetical protein